MDDSPTQLIGDAEISQIKSQIADRSIEKSELSNTEIKKQKKNIILGGGIGVIIGVLTGLLLGK